MKLLKFLVLFFMPLLSSAQLTEYNNLANWAAHPDKKDLADSIPEAFKNERREALADVFFIHPTTYTGNAVNNEWNARISNQSLNTLTDNRTIFNQASVFNGSCRIYAPRYRQAHIRAFYAPYSDNSKKAFEVAYADVRAAFEHFLRNYHKGRPIVIASHSQGSLYAIRILQDYFAGKELKNKLVCAYIVGFPVTIEDLKDIPFSSSAVSVGCAVSWRTYKDGFTPADSARERSGALCTNPVTWKNAETLTSFSEHEGGFFQGFGLQKNILTARVNKELGVLWINLKPQLAGLLGNLNNFHIADYNLFYADVRKNVKERVDAYLKGRL